jgi:hypothetical protein
MTIPTTTTNANTVPTPPPTAPATPETHPTDAAVRARVLDEVAKVMCGLCRQGAPLTEQGDAHEWTLPDESLAVESCRAWPLQALRAAPATADLCPDCGAHFGKTVNGIWQGTHFSRCRGLRAPAPATNDAELADYLDAVAANFHAEAVGLAGSIATDVEHARLLREAARAKAWAARLRAVVPPPPDTAAPMLPAGRFLPPSTWGTHNGIPMGRSLRSTHEAVLPPPDTAAAAPTQPFFGHVAGCEFTTDTGWTCAPGCRAGLRAPAPATDAVHSLAEFDAKYLPTLAGDPVLRAPATDDAPTERRGAEFIVTLGTAVWRELMARCGTRDFASLDNAPVREEVIDAVRAAVVSLPSASPRATAPAPTTEASDAV